MYTKKYYPVMHNNDIINSGKMNRNRKYYINEITWALKDKHICFLSYVDPRFKFLDLHI